ncbi:MAG: DUF362 domain-containing protein [Deltaproteobacteria bacterium]|nr:DUF362 domain-containing protein [Deltaproteobacteria bacterium]
MKCNVFVAETEPKYPEFPFSCADDPILLSLKALFAASYNDSENPFKKWVSPGGTVVIKPNWVRDFNPAKSDIDCLLTHASIIKHMVDWSARALDGQGTIIIADAPLQSCDYDRLLEITNVNKLVRLARDQYKNINIFCEDWRLTKMSGERGAQITSDQYIGDSVEKMFRSKHVLIDRGKDSFLEDIADYADMFRVTCYKPSLIKVHHAPGLHEYLVTRRIKEADLIINIPKMKTHIKAGLTGALKNLVGINGHKEFLPHHIIGAYFSGGDGYALKNFAQEWYDKLYDHMWEHYMEISYLKRFGYYQMLRVIVALARITGGHRISYGCWSGNETIWRMILDLNHITYFGETAAKKVINIVDGIVAGEREGPLRPSPKPIGVLMLGENPAYIDAVIARIMGYNISRIPTVYNAIYNRKSKFGDGFLEDLEISWIGRSRQVESIVFDQLRNFKFVKPKYWSRAELGSGSKRLSLNNIK